MGQLASQIAKRPPKPGGLASCSDPFLHANRCPLRSKTLQFPQDGTRIVDFGDLMIAKAEHLAQELVGVLAQ